MRTPLAHLQPERKPLGWVWVYGPGSLLGARLENALGDEAYVHRALEAPAKEPSSIVFCPRSERVEEVVGGLRHLRALAPQVPIVVFGSFANNVALARVALREGAGGFLHAGMPPEQLSRALFVAQKGEVVIPRELLKEMVAQKPKMDLRALTERQLEILKLMTAEGLSNAQIARRLWFSESTVKHHLRGAYKALGVKNRIQAAGLFRREGPNGFLGGDVSRRHGELTARKDRRTWKARSRGVVPRSLAK